MKPIRNVIIAIAVAMSAADRVRRRKNSHLSIWNTYSRTFRPTSAPANSSTSNQRNGRPKWEAIQNEAQTLYKNYQNEVVFLSAEQKKTNEQAIVDKEKEAAELKRKYFAPDGELFKKRESLVKPIQDEIYNAIKDISQTKGYTLILDRSSDTGIIFASPKIDISNEVLAKLGYASN